MEYKLKDLLNPELDKYNLISNTLNHSVNASKLYLIILALNKENNILSITTLDLVRMTSLNYRYIRDLLERFRQAGIMRKHPVKKPLKYIILSNFGDYKEIAKTKLEEGKNGWDETTKNN